MPKRQDSPAQGAGPPRQDELPPTAAELDARVRALEDERLRELGGLIEPDPDPPNPEDPKPPPAAPLRRDVLDDLFGGG